MYTSIMIISIETGGYESCGQLAVFATGASAYNDSAGVLEKGSKNIYNGLFNR
jgi:hypothetical protein